GVLAVEEAAHAVAEVLRGGVPGAALGGASASERCLHTEWGIASDLLGELDGPIEMSANGNDLGDQPDAKRLVRVELLRREQVTRTGRAELCRESPRRAPERHDAPGDLELCKYRISGRDSDLRGEDQFDSKRVATPVNGDHHGLRARLAQEVPWVDRGRWQHRCSLAGCDDGRNCGKIESGGEDGAVTEDDPDTEVLVLRQFGESSGDPDNDVQVPCVAFLGSVDAEQEQMVAALDGDAWFRHGSPLEARMAPRTI